MIFVSDHFVHKIRRSSINSQRLRPLLAFAAFKAAGDRVLLLDVFRAEVLFLLKTVSNLLFFSILQMVSHVFMADVGHSGQILSYADSAWSCVGNDIPCLLCC